MPEWPPLEEFLLQHKTNAKKVAELKEFYEKHSHEPFDFNNLLEKYCMGDVDVMLKSVLTFRRLCMDNSGWCPFVNDCSTLPSFVSHVFRCGTFLAKTHFRNNYLLPDQVAYIPENGYLKGRQQSVIGLKYMKWLKETQWPTLKHAGSREHEITVKDSSGKLRKVYVDGFVEETNTVFQFHGERKIKT